MDSDLLATIEEEEQQVGIIVDISVVKTVMDNTGDSEDETLGELPSLMMIVIPLSGDLQNHKNYVIYRLHNGSVTTIRETPNGDGEYIVVDQDSITLYARNFSQYAIGYTPNSNPSLWWLWVLIVLVVATGGYFGYKNKEQVLAFAHTIFEKGKSFYHQIISKIKKDK